MRPPSRQGRVLVVLHAHGKPLPAAEILKVKRIAVHALLRHLGSRPVGHLPRCRQTKKEMAFQTALFGRAIISCAEWQPIFYITQLVDLRIALIKNAL